MARAKESSPGLIVDAMLGSLARKLRAFGFDTLYYAEGTDAGIIKISKKERRVVVTADRDLARAAEKAGASVILASGATDGRQLSSMLRYARTKGILLEPGEPVCSICNGRLLLISAGEAARSLPLSLAARHRAFYRCKDCGRFYWRGSHWKKLRRLERLFRPKHP